MASKVQPDVELLRQFAQAVIQRYEFEVAYPHAKILTADRKARVVRRPRESSVPAGRTRESSARYAARCTIMDRNDGPMTLKERAASVAKDDILRATWMGAVRSIGA